MNQHARKRLHRQPANPVVLAARLRHAGALPDRRESRGGARNDQQRWFWELAEAQHEEQGADVHE